MKIKDILDTSRNVITVSQNERVGVALKSLLDNKISCLPVLDESGKVVGVISERDVIREIYKQPNGWDAVSVGSVMTKDILIGLEGDDLDYIMNIMSKNNIRHMPIMNGQALSGILSIRDVVKGMMHEVESENRYLKDYIGGKYEGYQ